MRIYTFGCYDGETGHYTRFLNEEVSPPTLYKTWGHPCSMGKIIDRFDGVLPPIDPHEREGWIACHYIHGFTVLAWWDRSIDHRRACNAAVWIEGKHEPLQALTIARDKLPGLFGPLPYDLLLGTEADKVSAEGKD